MSDKGKIIIIEAVPGDVGEIIGIKDEVWLATYPNEDYHITRYDILSRKDGNEMKVAKMKEDIKARNDTVHIWAAKDGGRIIGMCAAEKDGANNKLVALYILPDYQGIGLGRRVMAVALEWLGNDKDISLGVAEYNASAIRFYEKNGFEVTGPMEGYRLASGKMIPLLEMVRKSGKRSL